MKRDSEEPDLRFCGASASPAIVFTERNVESIRKCGVLVTDAGDRR